MPRVWIGTSGFSYADWVGPFYPGGLRPGRMLHYYCRHFPLVELNYTFYQAPTPAQLARLADQTPDGFQFLVKLPRTLSHDQHRRDLASFRLAVGELERRGRLLGLLGQFPQAFHHGAKALDWLAVLADELAGLSLAVEFRHRSWFRPDVEDWLRERQVTLVSVDVPALNGIYPRGLVRSGPRVYVRFHSRHADGWYGSDKERYDYAYSDAELMEWTEAVEHVASTTTEAWLLFNNCHRGQAAVNAQRLRQLVAERGSNFEVMEPFAAPEPGTTQGLLFS